MAITVCYGYGLAVSGRRKVDTNITAAWRDLVLAGWRLRGDVDILRFERDDDGVLLTDMKSSTTAKDDHRTQVACYAEMLEQHFADVAIAHAPISMAILYRGPADGEQGLSAEQVRERAEQQAACRADL